MKASVLPGNLFFNELTHLNWKQYEVLMGEKGGCGNCWCMLFRLPYREFQQNKPNGNKKLMHQLVNKGKPVGLILSIADEPIGWIAMAPREDYIKIEKSRVFKRIDNNPVWSITCFFIKKEYRKMGLSKQLIKGAVDFAKRKNIKILEAYPTIPYSENVPPPFLWVGVLSAFTDCGFKVVKQNSKTRAMVRLKL
ncbi:MAG TPA: GNAT family N-acetyltransferase [Chitinophagaceae bacterium]|nr:GNAT family N-acetyltransferase [Chitinophagaceae bacterium]